MSAIEKRTGYNIDPTKSQRRTPLILKQSVETYAWPSQSPGRRCEIIKSVKVAPNLILDCRHKKQCLKEQSGWCVANLHLAFLCVYRNLTFIS